MKEYVGNMKEYVGNMGEIPMKEYVGNMKQIWRDMWKIWRNMWNYVPVILYPKIILREPLPPIPWKNFEICLYIDSRTWKNYELRLHIVSGTWKISARCYSSVSSIWALSPPCKLTAVALGGTNVWGGPWRAVTMGGRRGRQTWRSALAIYNRGRTQNIKDMKHDLCFLAWLRNLVMAHAVGSASRYVIMVSYFYTSIEYEVSELRSTFCVISLLILLTCFMSYVPHRG